MSVLQSESLSYFNLTPKVRTKSISLEDISPLSGSRATTPALKANLGRPRLVNKLRSRSDNTFSKHGTRAQEGGIIHHSRYIQAFGRTTSDRGPSTPSCHTSNDSSEITPDLKKGRVTDGPRSDASSLTRSPENRDTRSLSRVLARRSCIDKSHSERDSQSLSHHRNRVPDSTDRYSLVIQPMRPPSVATKHSEPASEHRVTIEKAFSDHIPQILPPTPPTQQPRRRSSTKVRQLFSMSKDAFRKKNNRSNPRANEYIEEHGEHLKVQQATIDDHKTNLRKQQTANVLVRASSVLQEVKSSVAKMSSSQIISPNLSRTNNGPPRSPALVRKVRSMEMSLEDTASQSSSLADLRMGHPPNNTPDEQAKYTVINQNGESEQFFKVDISIRGQTSYLPSEARRIHTPPLLCNSRDGKKRGFFFDYNVTPEKDQLADARNQPNGGTFRTHGVNAMDTWDTIDKNPKHNSTMLVDFSSKTKVEDWYALQLAELDTLTEEDISESSEDKMTTSYFDVVQQQIRNDAQLDLSVPEHLPTSPLCPRHPRYWRIVKNKGPQFRGCWMHGFREFSENDKEKYDIMS